MDNLPQVTSVLCFVLVSVVIGITDVGFGLLLQCGAAGGTTSVNYAALYWFLDD